MGFALVTDGDRGWHPELEIHPAEARHPDGADGAIFETPDADADVEIGLNLHDPIFRKNYRFFSIFFLKLFFRNFWRIFRF